MTVWEKTEPGFGASGVNLGQISIMDRDTDLELSWVRKTLGMYTSFQNELGLDLEWDPIGGFIFLRNEQEMSAAREVLAVQKDRGVDIRYLDPKEIAGIEPCFKNDMVQGALFCPDEGRLEPFKVLSAFISLLGKQGVSIIRGEEACSFTVKDRRIESVRGRHISAAAGTVVLAAGSWTRSAAAEAGIEVPVFYHKGMAFVTLPSKPCINTVIVGGGFLLKQKSAGVSVGLGVSPQKNGTLILGQANEPGASDYNRDISIRGIAG